MMIHSIKYALSVFALFTFLLLANVCQASTDEIQIVALGTSFTSGKGVWKSDAFPAKLEAMLKAEGENVRVSNQGVNGNSTIDLLSRLGRSVPEGVDIVIYEYAIGNEQRAGISREETVRNSGKIISQLVARNIEVLLLIRAENQEGLQKRTQWFRKIIKKHDILFLPIEQPPSTLQADHQHPTAKAHEQIATDMLPSVRELIARVKARHK